MQFIERAHRVRFGKRLKSVNEKRPYFSVGHNHRVFAYFRIFTERGENRVKIVGEFFFFHKIERGKYFGEKFFVFFSDDESSAFIKGKLYREQSERRGGKPRVNERKGARNEVVYYYERNEKRDRRRENPVGYHCKGDFFHNSVIARYRRVYTF